MTNNIKSRVTGLDLFNAPKRAIKYIINVLIPIGLTIIGGRPKAGKSTIISQAAQAIAKGDRFLNEFESLRSKALYISLEESREDLEIRTHRTIRDNTNLENIDYRFEWYPLDQGGLEMLQVYLDENSDVKIVFIDTLSHFISNSGSKLGKGYGKEYDVAKKIRKIAKDKNIAMVLNHHTHKSSKGTIEDLYGSSGFTGAADNIILLEHDKPKRLGKLLVTSRYGDSEHALKFNMDMGCWEYLGELEEFNLTNEREEVLQIMNQRFGPIQVKEIAKEAGKSTQSISNLLQHLKKQGLIIPLGYGIYEITNLGQKSLAVKI